MENNNEVDVEKKKTEKTSTQNFINEFLRK